ncbi:hypothetical protein E4L30_004797 [Escherichia coli]|nr:hypothetical protein [Escherichia coli]
MVDASAQPHIVVTLEPNPWAAFYFDINIANTGNAPRNTDTIWLPGNICAYQFRLDNGGNDEGFGPLTITLQLKDKYGQTLVTRKMETEAFGDSNATRTTDAFLETECVENVATTEIIKATEESNGHRVSLPLSVFNPQDYHPLLITVSGKNVN